MKFGVVERKAPGQEVNGDSYLIEEFDDQVFIGVLDGQGLGEEARAAVEKAKKYIRDNIRSYGVGFADLVQGCHQLLRNTKGVELGMIWVDTKEKILYYTGIGGTEIRIFGPHRVDFPSQRGVVGVHLSGVRIYEYNYFMEDIFVLFTDGISSRFSFADSRVSVSLPPQKLAEQIAELFGKEDDDYVVVVGV